MNDNLSRRSFLQRSGLVGAGITGDRVIGGYDDSYYGRNVDPTTAEVDDGGAVLSAESIGATLLALADVDPAEFVSGVAPLTKRKPRFNWMSACSKVGSALRKSVSWAFIVVCGGA